MISTPDSRGEKSHGNGGELEQESAVGHRYSYCLYHRPTDRNYQKLSCLLVESPKEFQDELIQQSEAGNSQTVRLRGPGRSFCLNIGPTFWGGDVQTGGHGLCGALRRGRQRGRLELSTRVD